MFIKDAAVNVSLHFLFLLKAYMKRAGAKKVAANCQIIN